MRNPSEYPAWNVAKFVIFSSEYPFVLRMDWIWMMMRWTHPPPPPGGGGVTSICMHIGYVPRERPPFSALNFRSGAYHFHNNDQKIRSGASPFFIFAVPTETIIFKMFFIFNPFTASHGRLSPNAKRSAAPRVSGRPECQPDASWQFRRPAFSRSKRLKLVPEPRIFTLDRGARSGARADFSLCRGTYTLKPEMLN